MSHLTEAMKKTLTTSDLHLIDNPRLLDMAVVMRTFPDGFFQRIGALRKAAEADLAETSKSDVPPSPMR